MQILGFALFAKSDGTALQQWPVVPDRIDAPNGDVVFSAADGWDNDGYRIAPYSWTVADPAPVRRLVAKADIVDRLQAAGKLDAARVALDAADLYTRERWNVRNGIYADDPTALALLKAIGADPAVIMA